MGNDMPSVSAPATWQGRPIVIYDRCANPNDTFLADRVAACRTFALKQHSPVRAQYIDYGQAALVDGRSDNDDWLDVGMARTALHDAMERTLDEKAWLLVWHPDRLSSFSRCREIVLDRLKGRVFRVDGRIVSPRLDPHLALAGRA